MRWTQSPWRIAHFVGTHVRHTRRMDAIIRPRVHATRYYFVLHLTRWKDLCCGKFKTLQPRRSIGLLNYCAHCGPDHGQWEIRFFRNGWALRVWRGDHRTTRSSYKQAFGVNRVRSSPLGQCWPDSIVLLETMKRYPPCFGMFIFLDENFTVVYRIGASLTK